MGQKPRSGRINISLIASVGPLPWAPAVLHKHVLTVTIALSYTKEVALNLKNFSLKIEVLTSPSELSLSSGTEDVCYLPGQGAGRFIKHLNTLIL